MNKKELKELLNKLGDIIGEDDGEEVNNLVEELENNLLFKGKKEHVKWLECLQGFKFWEDFEEMTLNIIEREQEKALLSSREAQKYITFSSLSIAWNCHLNQKEEETLRRLFDIYRIASKNQRAKKVREDTFERAATLYKEWQKLNRQNDTLLVLDNDFNAYNSDYTKKLHERNEKQEKKVKELAKGFGLKLVYYSHLATFQRTKTREDLNLNRML